MVFFGKKILSAILMEKRERENIFIAPPLQVKWMVPLVFLILILKEYGRCSESECKHKGIFINRNETYPYK